ncbi:MAG: tRNA pseudouridine(38-40) synthase TruA [Oscillospiraceae bacterium]|nr:tRNA pseudouridine(38-40) synthase TruA [Oscillospiraceae bacterium]
MKNLKFFCSFNGADFHGFQRQPNVPTIQGEIEAALHKVLGVETAAIKISGCSRTDAGVHARRFCFNAHINNAIPCENLVRALNDRLPRAIVILSCEEADTGFNARFSAKSKEYIYLLNNKKQRDVFCSSYHYPHELNIELLQEAAQLFIGEHDFAAFHKHCTMNNEQCTIREIYSFNVKEKDGFVEFAIRGNGFLYNMVRILAGTLIYVNEGKRNADDILEAFKTGEREKAGKTLPPHGLYLNEVFYA